jgi:hypothetical protein
VKPLADLRRAQAALDPPRVIDALDRALATWRAPDSLWRARLKREHGVFSPEVLERGVVLGLRGWTGEALARLRARELLEPCHVPPVVAVWLAGGVPTAAFSAILLPLVAGAAVYAKPASADPVSPRLFVESLRAVDEKLAAAVAIGSDPAALGLADAVVAHGSDAAIAAIRARVPVDRPFVAHGHKLSAAAVGRDAEPERAAQALALDAALYDGRGCLSPAYVMVEDDPPGRAHAFGAALAAALERLAVELPRGPLSDAERAALHDVRAAFAAREDARVWLSKPPLAFCVVLSDFRRSPPFPGLLRSLPLLRVRDADEAAGWCASFAPHLSTLAVAGFGRRTDALARAALHAGGSRLCPLGRMQLPPIDWRHDGAEPLRSLVRVLDREDEADPREEET